MPSRAVPEGLTPFRLTPSKTMLPDVGSYTELRQLKIEVLPAPFGPMMANSSPACTSKVTLSSAVTPPKRSATSRDIEERLRLAHRRFHDFAGR